MLIIGSIGNWSGRSTRKEEKRACAEGSEWCCFPVQRKKIGIFPINGFLPKVKIQNIHKCHSYRLQKFSIWKIALFWFILFNLRELAQVQMPNVGFGFQFPASVPSHSSCNEQPPRRHCIDQLARSFFFFLFLIKITYFTKTLNRLDNANKYEGETLRKNFPLPFYLLK